jgi:stage V sporulation protein B
VHVDKFFKDSFILTISNMVTGIIAFVFSIILSRELGAEGLGLYSLIMPVYGLLLCLTTDGLITASSKISAVYSIRKDISNLNKTLSTVFVFILMWSVSVALLVFLCNKAIAVHIVRDARAAGALAVLAPALVFVPLSAIIKGYFYGLGNYKVTASVDIIEKLLRVAILTGTIAVLALSDVENTVSAAYFALAAGELISLLILYTCYRIQRKKLTGIKCKSKSRIQLLFDVFVISLPLCLNGILSSILSTISTLILPRRLIAAGFSYGDALSMIGKFGGMALNISYLPFIVIGSMLTVLVPELSLSMSRKDFWSSENRIAQVMRLACAIGVSTAIICLILPDMLGQLFYKRDDLGDMIRFSAVICLFTFVSSPTFGILNALGKQNILLKNSLIISLESLVLIFVLTGIPGLNIYGYGLSMIITSLTALVINLREIKKICEIKIGLQDITVIVLAGIAAYLLSFITNRLFWEAAPALRAAAVVVASFGAVLGLNGLAMRYRTN